MSFKKEKAPTRHTQSTWQRWLPVIAGIFLISFFGSIMWSSGKYNNSTIIQKHFHPSSFQNNDPTIVGSAPISNPKYVENQYLVAESYYRNNDFTKSIGAYDIVLENKKNTIYDLSRIDFEVAEWNRTLMLLGNGDRAKVIQKLEAIATSDFSEKYKKEAIQLKELLNSFWYGWAN